MSGLSPAPAFPIKGMACRIAFTALDPTTNVVTLVAVSAPEGSAIAAKLTAAEGQRVEEYSGRAADPWDFKPDFGGVYTFRLEESLVTTTAPRFEDDTLGAPLPEPITWAFVSLYVGESVRIQLGSNPDQAALLLYVWNATIRATSVAVHGVLSPAVVDPKSSAAETAIGDPALLQAIGELVEMPAETLLGSFATDFQNVRAAYSTHIANASYHDNSDTDNAVGASWATSTLKSSAAGVNQLWQALRNHTQKLARSFPADPDTPEPVHGAVDGTSAYQTTGANADRTSQYLALADIVVRLQEHKAVGSSVHSPTDSTSEPAMSKLLTIFVRWLEALKASQESVVIPPSRNAGAVLFEQFAGAKRAQ